MFADLLIEVEVLLRLHWGTRRRLDSFDSVEPLDTSGADVSHHNHPQRIAVDLWQGLSVHLPGQHDFVGFYLGPWYADEVVHDVVLLEVGISTVELEVLAAIDESAAGFDDLFQAYSNPASSSNSTFERSVHLVRAITFDFGTDLPPREH